MYRITYNILYYITIYKTKGSVSHTMHASDVDDCIAFLYHKLGYSWVDSSLVCYEARTPIQFIIKIPCQENGLPVFINTVTC